MRAVGIWVFGIFASGLIGGVIGSRLESGYSDDSLPGFFAGVFAFACFRLWFTHGGKASN